MLVWVAIVAITIIATRDYMRVQAAREQYEWMMAAKEAGRVPFSAVVASSFRLMDVERSALWISRRAASSRHVARLKDLLRQAINPLTEASPEEMKPRADFILNEIRQHDPDEADKLFSNLPDWLKQPVAEQQ
jgi:hypothetical protein